jgi:hypothetical protein
MNRLLAMIFSTVILVAAVSAQTDAQKYRHHFWGIVSDENSRPLVGVMVCWIPVGIPVTDLMTDCTATDKNGEYALTAKLAANKHKYYTVFATTAKSTFPRNKASRSIYAETVELTDTDDCRQLDLQFKPLEYEDRVSGKNRPIFRFLTMKRLNEYLENFRL